MVIRHDYIHHLHPVTHTERPVAPYNVPQARQSYPPDIAPLQPDTEPLPVAQPPVVVHHTHTHEKEVIREREIVSVPSPTPVAALPTPQRPVPTIETDVPLARGPETPVEVVPLVEQPEIENVQRSDPEKLNVPVVHDAVKNLTFDKKIINEPLNFSPPETSPQAAPRKKLQHKKREQGRQRKFHQTIAILEMYHDGDLDTFNRLDEQMQRYYQREYPEYFGRDSKSKSGKRLANRTKAKRTRRDSERRRIAQISRSIQAVSHHGSEIVDIQDTRQQRDVHIA